MVGGRSCFYDVTVISSWGLAKSLFTNIFLFYFIINIYFCQFDSAFCSLSLFLVPLYSTNCWLDRFFIVTIGLIRRYLSQSQAFIHFFFQESFAIVPLFICISICAGKEGRAATRKDKWMFLNFKQVVRKSVTEVG